jgi:DNA-binding response OmpR family regulator
MISERRRERRRRTSSAIPRMRLTAGSTTRSSFDVRSPQVASGSVPERHHSSRRSRPPRAARSVIVTPAGTLCLDLACFQAFANERLLGLTRLEFDLLAYLVLEAPRVVSYEELFHNVIRSARADGTSLIRVHVTHLRGKLKELREALETVRGRGLRVRVARPTRTPPR